MAVYQMISTFDLIVKPRKFIRPQLALLVLTNVRTKVAMGNIGEVTGNGQNVGREIQLIERMMTTHVILLKRVPLVAFPEMRTNPSHQLAFRGATQIMCRMQMPRLGK